MKTQIRRESVPMCIDTKTLELRSRERLTAWEESGYPYLGSAKDLERFFSWVNRQMVTIQTKGKKEEKVISGEIENLGGHYKKAVAGGDDKLASSLLGAIKRRALKLASVRRGTLAHIMDLRQGRIFPPVRSEVLQMGLVKTQVTQGSFRPSMTTGLPRQRAPYGKAIGTRETSSQFGKKIIMEFFAKIAGKRVTRIPEAFLQEVYIDGEKTRLIALERVRRLITCGHMATTCSGCLAHARVCYVSFSCGARKQSVATSRPIGTVSHQCNSKATCRTTSRDSNLMLYSRDQLKRFIDAIDTGAAKRNQSRLPKIRMPTVSRLIPMAQTWRPPLEEITIRGEEPARVKPRATRAGKRVSRKVKLSGIVSCPKWTPTIGGTEIDVCEIKKMSARHEACKNKTITPYVPTMTAGDL